MFVNHILDGFSVTKNLMAQCLGMPLGFPYGRADISNNLHAVQDYIQNLDEEFSLVMIVEYFHESLILFKRLMKLLEISALPYGKPRGIPKHCAIKFLVTENPSGIQYRKVAAS
jgi:hypothetical protein